MRVSFHFSVVHKWIDTVFQVCDIFLVFVGLIYFLFCSNTVYINRSFNEDLILALIVRLVSSVKLCITNNTFYLDMMCFLIELSKITKITFCKI